MAKVTSTPQLEPETEQRASSPDAQIVSEVGGPITRSKARKQTGQPSALQSQSSTSWDNLNGPAFAPATQVETTATSVTTQATATATTSKSKPLRLSNIIPTVQAPVQEVEVPSKISKAAKTSESGIPTEQVAGPSTNAAVSQEVYAREFLKKQTLDVIKAIDHLPKEIADEVYRMCEQYKDHHLGPNGMADFVEYKKCK